MVEFPLSGYDTNGDLVEKYRNLKEFLGESLQLEGNSSEIGLGGKSNETKNENYILNDICKSFSSLVCLQTDTVKRTDSRQFASSYYINSISLSKYISIPHNIALRAACTASSCPTPSITSYSPAKCDTQFCDSIPILGPLAASMCTLAISIKNYGSEASEPRSTTLGLPLDMKVFGMKEDTTGKPLGFVNEGSNYSYNFRKYSFLIGSLAPSGQSKVLVAISCAENTSETVVVSMTGVDEYKRQLFASTTRLSLVFEPRKEEPSGEEQGQAKGEEEETDRPLEKYVENRYTSYIILGVYAVLYVVYHLMSCVVKN